MHELREAKIKLNKLTPEQKEILAKKARGSWEKNFCYFLTPWQKKKLCKTGRSFPFLHFLLSVYDVEIFRLSVGWYFLYFSLLGFEFHFER